MDKKKNTYLSELFLENLNGDFSRQAVLRALEKCNDEIRKRMGAYPCAIKEGTRMFSAYGSPLIEERHRHRYEFNNEFRTRLSDAGLIISGTSPDERIVETVETSSDGFFIGVQFHPEFTSRPNKPNPLFSEFIKASLEFNGKKHKK